MEDKEEEKESKAEDKELEASLNSSSVMGLNSPKMIKFIGTIEGKQVLILLDNGATHNFIFDRIVHEL